MKGDEEQRGKARIGTTSRGIARLTKTRWAGAAFVCDLSDPDKLQRLRENIDVKQVGVAIDPDRLFESAHALGDIGLLRRCRGIPERNIDEGKTVLFEGAQGDAA